MITKIRALAAGLLLVGTAWGLVGCSGSTSTARPSTTAKLLILTPKPNELTKSDVTLTFQVVGGTVLPPQVTSGPLRGDQGHIHVTVDGKLVAMAYATTQDLHGLVPGAHAVLAEWVATDHRPFANRVVAAVLFRVGP